MTQDLSTLLLDPEHAHYASHRNLRLTPQGYAIIGTRLLHRILLPEAKLVDHRNGDKLDNRLTNLRAVTQSQNSANSNAHRDGSSQYKGVSWDRNSGRWNTRIMKEGVVYRLGLFTDEHAAAAAYDTAALALFGEFARTNRNRDAA